MFRATTCGWPCDDRIARFSSSSASSACSVYLLAFVGKVVPCETVPRLAIQRPRSYLYLEIDRACVCGLAMTHGLFFVPNSADSLQNYVNQHIAKCANTWRNMLGFSTEIFMYQLRVAFSHVVNYIYEYTPRGRFNPSELMFIGPTKP